MFAGVGLYVYPPACAGARGEVPDAVASECGAPRQRGLRESDTIEGRGRRQNVRVRIVKIGLRRERAGRECDDVIARWHV